jgi:hypothetical protein
MTKVKMSSMYILFGITLLSLMHLADAENLTDWNPGDGGFKWRINCDFPDDDLYKFLFNTTTRDDKGNAPNRTATSQECGRLCIANPECSHFVLGDFGHCYMKKRH